MKSYKNISFNCPICNHWEFYLRKGKHAYFFKCGYCQTETKHIRGSFQNLLRWWQIIRGNNVC